MKKYFQFNGTINGTTYFLRMLFTIVLSIPFLIIIFAFFGIFAIEYAEIEMQNPESFDQQALEEKRRKILEEREAAKKAKEEEENKDNEKIELLEYFLEFIKGEDLNYVLSGYFSKFFTALNNKSPNVIIRYLFAKQPETLKCFLNHMKIKAISKK